MYAYHDKTILTHRIAYPSRVISECQIIATAYGSSAPKVVASTPIESRLHGLDGWRAIAILFVLIGHGALNGHISTPETASFVQSHLPNGRDGVRIFFILSGFLITSLLLREELKTGRLYIFSFFARRTLRIFPVYLIYVAAIACLNIYWDWGFSWRNFIAPLTFSTGLWLEEYNTWVFGHFWTLTVEELFYLCWPVFFSFAYRQVRIPFALFTIVGLPVLRVVTLGTLYQPYFQYGFLLNIDFIMMGCLAAILVDRFKSEIAKIETWVGTTAIVIGLSVFWGAERWVQYGSTSWPSSIDIGIASTLMGAGLAVAISASTLFTRSTITRLLEFPPLKTLGGISYGVYIWQQLIINPYQATLYSWQMFPANILASILAGWLSWHLIEKWFLRLKAKFSETGKIEARIDKETL